METTIAPEGRKPRPLTPPAAIGQVRQRHNEGHGRRLTAAFEALEAFPALAESRNRLLRLVREDQPSVADVVQAVESDVALVIAVLRIANRARSPKKGKVASIQDAVAILTPGGVEALASRTQVYDFFERTPVWDAAPERFRLHAVATQRAADHVARTLEYKDRNEILVSAVLHDIGKLVLAHAYPGDTGTLFLPPASPSSPRHIHGSARTPEERVQSERRELGVDHAVVGGVLARRWGLPGRLASAIERHHVEDAQPEAAIVRLGDMLAHYGHGLPVDPKQMSVVARSLDLSIDQLRSVMYELPYPQGDRRAVEPCPLSNREVDVLRRLRDGKVYKQIALELELSTSTVRTHLHNTYAKLGAVDRAQAVLIATQRGWI